MDKFIAAFASFVIMLALAFGLAMLLAYPTMWFINYLFAPSFLLFVFGGAKITFWQAFVFNALFQGVVNRSNSSSRD